MLKENCQEHFSPEMVSYAQILLRKSSPTSSPSIQSSGDQLRPSTSSTTHAFANNMKTASPYSNAISRDNPKFHSFPKSSTSGRIRSNNTARNQNKTIENAPSSVRYQHRRTYQASPRKEEKIIALPLHRDDTDDSTLFDSHQEFQSPSTLSLHHSSQSNFGKPSFSDILRRNTQRIEPKPKKNPVSDPRPMTEDNPRTCDEECVNAVEPTKTVTSNYHVQEIDTPNHHQHHSPIISQENETLPNTSVQDHQTLSQPIHESLHAHIDNEKPVYDANSYAGILTKGMGCDQQNMQPACTLSLSSKEEKKEMDLITIIPVLEVEADLYHHDRHLPIPGLLFRSDMSRRPSKKRKKHKTNRQAVTPPRVNNEIIIQEFEIPEIQNPISREKTKSNHPKDESLINFQTVVDEEIKMKVHYDESLPSASSTIERQGSKKGKNAIENEIQAKSKKKKKKELKDDTFKDSEDSSRHGKTTKQNNEDLAKSEHEVVSKKDVSRRNSKKSKAIKSEDMEIEEIVQSINEKEPVVMDLENTKTPSRRASKNKRPKQKKMDSHTLQVSSNSDSGKLSKEEALAQIMKRLEYIEGIGGKTQEYVIENKTPSTSTHSSLSDSFKIRETLNSEIIATNGPDESKFINKEVKPRESVDSQLKQDKINDEKPNVTHRLSKDEEKRELSASRKVVDDKSLKSVEINIAKKMKDKGVDVSSSAVPSKEKKSYDFIDESCDDWMNAGIGDISDSDEKESEVETASVPKETKPSTESCISAVTKEKKSYDFIDESCDDWMNAGIGDISDSDESNDVPSTRVEAKSSTTPKKENNDPRKAEADVKPEVLCTTKGKTYSNVTSSFVPSQKIETSEEIKMSNYSHPALIVAIEDNKPKLEKDVDSDGFETVMTKREKRHKLNSLRLSECEESMAEVKEIINAGMDGEDNGNSPKETVKSNSQTSSAQREVISLSTSSTPLVPKDKKSYDFIDESCDDWMNAGIGDISDSEGSEEETALVPKETKLSTEPCISAVTKEKKSYDFIDESCDDWMNAGIGDISDSDEIESNDVSSTRVKSSTTPTNDLRLKENSKEDPRNDNEVLCATKEKTYSSITSSFVPSQKTEPCDQIKTTNYSYPALIVSIEDNTPKLEKEVDSDGFETVLTKRERRHKLNSLRLSTSEYEESIAEIQEIINADIDRKYEGESVGLTLQKCDNASSKDHIEPAEELIQSEQDCQMTSPKPKSSNESAVKEEYQNELTRTPLSNVLNQVPTVEDVSLPDVRDKALNIGAINTTELFSNAKSFLSLKTNPAIDEHEKKGSQPVLADDPPVCESASIKSTQNEYVKKDSNRIECSISVETVDNDEKRFDVKSNGEGDVTSNASIENDGHNSSYLQKINYNNLSIYSQSEKSEVTSSIMELDRESNDVIRNLASTNLASTTRPSSRSSFTEDRFDTGRRYTFRKRDSMDSGRSSSIASSMSTVHRKYVRIRDTKPFSNDNSKSGSLADLSSIKDKEEGSLISLRSSASQGYPSKESSPRPPNLGPPKESISGLSLASRIANICNSSTLTKIDEPPVRFSSSNEDEDSEKKLLTHRRVSDTTYHSIHDNGNTSIVVERSAENGETNIQTYTTHDVLSQQTQITSDKDSSTEIDFESIAGKKKKSKKRTKHTLDAVSKTAATSDGANKTKVPDLNIPNPGLLGQQGISSLSSMDESLGKKGEQMKDKVMKKRKRPRNILAKSTNNEETTTTTTDSDEIDPVNSSNILNIADVNLNDLADSLLEEDEDKMSVDDQESTHLTPTSVDDEEFEELTMSPKDNLLWSTLAGLPPRPQSPVPRNENFKEESSDHAKSTSNPRFLIRDNEQTDAGHINKRIFDKDGYEIHVSRRTRTNSRNSQTELDENTIQFTSRKLPLPKSILDVAKNDNHFANLADRVGDKDESDNKTRGKSSDVIPHKQFLSTHARTAKKTNDSFSNTRVRVLPQSNTEPLDEDTLELELRNNLSLDYQSHYFPHSCINDAELLISYIMNELPPAEDNIRAGNTKHISSESLNLAPQMSSELALRKINDRANGDRDTLGYPSENEEIATGKISYFQVLVSELFEDVQDLGILLKSLKENEIEGAVSSIQYALKTVPELATKAEELEHKIEKSGLNPSDLKVLSEDLSSVKDEIKSFKIKVEALKESMDNYLKESQHRKDEIRKYHSLLLDLEGWCDGMDLAPDIKTSQSKEYYSQSLNSAKVLEYDLQLRSQELSSLIHEAQSLSEYGDVKKMSETLIKRLKDLKDTVDTTASMLPERINILKVQKRSSRNVFIISA